MPKISIIIPMYNVEEYISKCIESCIGQTLKDIEIIIINDESKDNSLEIAKKYEEKDSRIIVYDQKNSGVSVARNKGMTEASAEWIIFLDGDDWLDLDACEKMYDIVKENCCDVLITGFYEENTNYTKKDQFLNIGYKKFDKSNNIELVKNCIYRTEISQPNSVTNIGVPWAKIYRKKFLNENDLKFKIGLKRMQDMVFNIETLYLADNIIYNNFPTYHYRCQNNSVTNKYSADFDKTSELILQYISEFMEKNNLKQELSAFYRIKTFLLFDEIIKLKYVPKKNEMSLINKIKDIHKLKKNKIYSNNASFKLNKYFNKKMKLKNLFYCLNCMFPLYIINLYKMNKKRKNNY